MPAPDAPAPCPASCPVCTTNALRAFMTVAGKHYWRCDHCLATLLDPKQRLPIDQERSYYDLHRNDPEDQAYQAFLSKLAVPVLARIKPRCRVLDFGCGPGPGLPPLFSAAGHDVHLYDPCFQPDTSALSRPYDVILCSEVVEHFHNPAYEFAGLARLLNPGGCIAIMTCFQTDDDRFVNWHYRRDPTHVVFYRSHTFQCIADALELRCEVPARNIALLWR